MPESKDMEMNWKKFIVSLINSWPLLILIVLLVFHGTIKDKVIQMSGLKLDQSSLSVVFDKAFMDYVAVETIASTNKIQSMDEINTLRQAALLTPVYRSILANAGVDVDKFTILNETEQISKNLLASVATLKENPSIAQNLEILAAKDIRPDEIGTIEGDKKIAAVIAERRRAGLEVGGMEEIKSTLEKKNIPLDTIPEVNSEVLKKVNPRTLRRSVIPSTRKSNTE